MVESPSEFKPDWTAESASPFATSKPESPVDPLPYRLPDEIVPPPLSPMAGLAPLGQGDLLTRVATIEQHLRYMYQLNGDSSHQPWYRPPGVEPV